MSKTFTALGIDKIKPTSKRSEIADAETKGLYLVVQPSGVKSFAVRYRHRGKTVKYTLGRHPKLTLSEARKAAREAINYVERGIDPKDVKSAPELFEMAFQQFLERHVSQNRSKYEVERQFQHDFLPAFGGMLITDINKRDIIKVLDKAVDRNAKVMANRLLATLRKFFSWAVSRDLVANNPCETLRAPSKEHSRDRILSHQEIRTFWHSTAYLSLDNDPTKAYERYFKFLLLCGQRRTEVAEMRWDELDQNTWHLPAARSKNAKSHTVPLTSFMHEVLGPRSNESDYVFSLTGKHPINNIGRVTSRLKVIMENEASENYYADWKPHDLRRTVASEMARLGVYQEVLERLQNRSGGKLGGVAGIYNRYDYKVEKLDALERWHTSLKEILNG